MVEKSCMAPAKSFGKIRRPEPFSYIERPQSRPVGGPTDHDAGINFFVKWPSATLSKSATKT